MDEPDAAFFVPVPVADNHLQDIPIKIGYFLRFDGISQGIGHDLVGDKPDYAGFSTARDPDFFNRRDSAGEG